MKAQTGVRAPVRIVDGYVAPPIVRYAPEPRWPWVLLVVGYAAIIWLVLR